MTIKELSIGGSTFGISRGTQWGYPVAPGFLGETWEGRGGEFSGVIYIEGDVPIIKFGEDQFCGEERTGVWPSGGGGRNIDPTETIEGDDGFIKFGGLVWPPGEPEGS